MTGRDPLGPLLGALTTARRGQSNPPPHRLATITGTDDVGISGAHLQFDGETSPSARAYTYLSSYTPTVDDRVLLAQVGTTWVILGAVIV